MQQWKFHVTAHCLLYNEDEDNTYVITCQLTATSAIWATQMELLSVKMEGMHSPDELTRVIILGLNK